MFVPQKTCHKTLTHFFAYDNDFDGFEDLTLHCSDFVDLSDKGEQTPTASVSTIHLDHSPEPSPGSMSSLTSWADSDTASYEDELELSESVDHKLSSHWEDRNEKVCFSDLAYLLY